MAEDLRVVAKTYDLILWLVPLVEKFPRSQRFVLGDRIETTALQILEILIEAAYEKDKGMHLRQANLTLEKLRYLVRIAKDLKFVSLKQYEYLAREMNEVGVLIGGWGSDLGSQLDFIHSTNRSYSPVGGRL